MLWYWPNILFSDGFITLSDEHVPETQAFVKFPLYMLEFVVTVVDGDDLKLTFRCYVCGVDHPERYRVLGTGAPKVFFRYYFVNSVNGE